MSVTLHLSMRLRNYILFFTRKYSNYNKHTRRKLNITSFFFFLIIEIQKIWHINQMEHGKTKNPFQMLCKVSRKGKISLKTNKRTAMYLLFIPVYGREYWTISPVLVVWWVHAELVELMIVARLKIWSAFEKAVTFSAIYQKLISLFRK